MLIHTLAAFFIFTNLISPLEASAILLTTAYITYLLTPKRQVLLTDTPKPLTFPSFYMYIHATWLGRESLIRAFLPFFILFNSALFYIDYRAATITYTISSWFTSLIILAIPLIWWTVAVWRCSYNHSNQLGACIARFCTIAAYYEYILRFIIRYYYPQIWFDCQQIVIELGDCF